MPQEAAARKPTSKSSRQTANPIACVGPDLASVFDLEFKNRMLAMAEDFHEYRGESKEAIRALQKQVVELQSDMMRNFEELHRYNTRLALIIGVLVAAGALFPQFFGAVGAALSKLP